MIFKRITGVILAAAMSVSGLTLHCAMADVSAVATITYNNHTYSLFDYSITWENAKTYCENLGGYLATITSAEEQAQLESLISSGGKRTYWIGLRETETEGNWNWVTDEEYSYTNWGSGEPNDSGSEAYCEIVKTPWDALTFGTWNDMKNSGDTSGTTTLAYKGFICEWGDYVTEDGSSPYTYNPYCVSLTYPKKFLGFVSKTYLPGTPSSKKSEYIDELYEWAKEFGYENIITEYDAYDIMTEYMPTLAYYEDSIAFTSDEYTTFDVMRDVIMLNSTLKSLNKWENEYLRNAEVKNLNKISERAKDIISEYSEYEESTERNPLATVIYTVYSQPIINTAAKAELKIVKSFFTGNVKNVINEGGAEELYDLMVEFNAAWKESGIGSLSGIPDEVLEELKSKSFKNIGKALFKSVLSDIAAEYESVELIYDVLKTSKSYISGFKATSLIAQYAPGVLFQIQLLKLGREIYDAIAETKSSQYFMVNYYFKHNLPDLYDEIVDSDGNVMSDVITYNMFSGRTDFADELMNNWFSTNPSVADDETKASLMTVANTAAQIQLADINSMREEIVKYWAERLLEEDYNKGLCQIQYTFSANDTFELLDAYGNVIGMYSPETGFTAYGASTVSDEDEEEAEEASYIVTVDLENLSVNVVVKDTSMRVVSYEQNSTSVVTAVTYGGSVYSTVYTTDGTASSITYSLDENGNITAVDSTGETIESIGEYTQSQSTADFDAENLQILYAVGESAEGVASDVELLTEGTCGSRITWSSDNEDVITADGKVTRTAENQTVTLTATISSGEISVSKEFVLTVLSNKVIVSFDSCGGSETEAQTLTAGESADVSQVPERPGYTFDGWYIDSYYEYPYESEPIYDSITLYAKWTGNGTVWSIKDDVLIIYDMGEEIDLNAGEAEWYSDKASFDTVYIEEGITAIGENAFYGCDGLKAAVIPDSVESIADTAFEGCGGIEEIYCYKGSAADNEEIYSASEGAVIYYIGDVDFDKDIDKADAVLMLKFSAGISSAEDISGYILDYSYDGKFDILDSIAVINEID